MFFAIRIGLISGLASFLVLAGLSMLAGHAVNRGLEEQEIARFRYLVTSLKRTVEANLGLGLPIQDLPVLQSTIERDRTAEANVRAIEIIGPNDVALYSTDRGAIGGAISPIWKHAIEEDHRTTWVAYDRGEVAIGQAIKNDFGQRIGQVVLVVAQDQVTPPTRLTLRFASLGVIPILIASLLAFMACSTLMLYRVRVIGRARAVWHGTWSSERSPPLRREYEPLGPSLETACRRARDTTEQALVSLDRAKRRLMDLDDAV